MEMAIEMHQRLCLQNHGSLRIHLSYVVVMHLHAQLSRGGVKRLHTRPSRAGVMSLLPALNVPP